MLLFNIYINIYFFLKKCLKTKQIYTYIYNIKSKGKNSNKIKTPIYYHLFFSYQKLEIKLNLGIEYKILKLIFC